MEPTVTLPAADLERLMNIAAQQNGIADTPTLLLFANVRLLLEQAKRA
jgi:hypothetical protein